MLLKIVKIVLDYWNKKIRIALWKWFKSSWKNELVAYCSLAKDNSNKVEGKNKATDLLLPLVKIGWLLKKIIIIIKRQREKKKIDWDLRELGSKGE